MTQPPASHWRQRFRDELVDSNREHDGAEFPVVQRLAEEVEAFIAGEIAAAERRGIERTVAFVRRGGKIEDALASILIGDDTAK